MKLNLVWPPTPMMKIAAAGVGICIAIIVLWLWVSANERRARDLAIAEERERAAQVLADENAKREKERQIEREQTAKLIEANNELRDSLARAMTVRNQQAERTIIELRQPKAPEQVVKDSQKELGYAPPVQDGSFRLTQEQFQELIAIKVDRDRLALNNTDLEKQLRLERDTNTRLTSQLSSFESTVKESNLLIMAQRDVIDSYKKVAKKSRFRTVVETTGKIGVGIAAGYLGARLGAQ